jgi:hypothetical protein
MQFCVVRVHLYFPVFEEKFVLSKISFCGGFTFRVPFLYIYLGCDMLLPHLKVKYQPMHAELDTYTFRIQNLYFFMSRLLNSRIKYQYLSRNVRILFSRIILTLDKMYEFLNFLEENVVTLDIPCCFLHA